MQYAQHMVDYYMFRGAFEYSVGRTLSSDRSWRKLMYYLVASR